MRPRKKKKKRSRRTNNDDIDAMAHRVYTTHHNGNEALLFWMFCFFSLFLWRKEEKTQENSSVTNKYSITLTIYFFLTLGKKAHFNQHQDQSYMYVSVCMNTDHYLDLHMSRIMLLTFWHIFLVLFNFWRAFYARYSHKMTCIIRSVSVIVRVNGVQSK